MSFTFKFLKTKQNSFKTIMEQNILSEGTFNFMIMFAAKITSRIHSVGHQITTADDSILMVASKQRSLMAKKIQQ